MARVHIIPGFAEGSHQMRALLAALKSAGHEVTSDATEADTIIAHSGGIYLVPKDHQAKTVILSGLPYYPGTRLGTRLRRKLRYDIQSPQISASQLLQKSAFNGYYVVRHPKRWLDMHRAMRDERLPSAPIVIAVHHAADPMSTSELIQALAQENNWHFVSRPGGHDDLWHQPEVYVQLLK